MLITLNYNIKYINTNCKSTMINKRRVLPVILKRSMLYNKINIYLLSYINK